MFFDEVVVAVAEVISGEICRIADTSHCKFIFGMQDDNVLLSGIAGSQQDDS